MVDTRPEQLALANELKMLLENETFKKIFQELYIDAFAITNLYNLHSYDDPARRRFVEKSLARSVFVKFIDDILEDGRMAQASLSDEFADEQSTD